MGLPLKNVVKINKASFPEEFHIFLTLPLKKCSIFITYPHNQEGGVCILNPIIHPVEVQILLILICWIVIYQAPVVQKIDNAIGFLNTYPLDSDLSHG